MAPICCPDCGKNYNPICSVCILRRAQQYRGVGNGTAIGSVTNITAPSVLKLEQISPILTASSTKHKPAGAVEKTLPAPGTFLNINQDPADKTKPAQCAGKPTMRIKLPKRADYNLEPIHKLQSRPVIRCDVGGGFFPHSDQNAVSEEHGALDSPTPDALGPELHAQAYFFGQSAVISKFNPMSKKRFSTPALDDPFVSGPHKPVLNLKPPEEALPASDPRCEKNRFMGRPRDVTIFSEEHAVPKSNSNFKFKNPFNSNTPARPTLDQEIVPDPLVFTPRPRLTDNLPRGPPPKNACAHCNPAPGRLQDAPSSQAQAREISKPDFVFKIKPRFHTTNHLPTSATPLAAAPPNFQPKPRSRDDNNNWIMVDRERDRDDEWVMVQKGDEEFWEDVVEERSFVEEVKPGCDFGEGTKA